MPDKQTPLAVQGKQQIGEDSPSPIHLTLSAQSLERGWIAPLREAGEDYLKRATDAWSLSEAASNAAKAAEIFAKAAAMEQVKQEIERLDEASDRLNEEMKNS